MAVKLSASQARLLGVSKARGSTRSGDISKASLCSDNTLNDAYQQALEALRHIQGHYSNKISPSYFSLSWLAECTGRRWDGDNLFKGVLDGFAALIGGNDKECTSGEYKIIDKDKTYL